MSIIKFILVINLFKFPAEFELTDHNTSDFFNVLYESRCMWSVSYRTPRTVSEIAYVKCGA
jgi:hypothetical protein